jgi:hypothetical protein
MIREVGPIAEMLTLNDLLGTTHVVDGDMVLPEIDARVPAFLERIEMSLMKADRVVESLRFSRCDSGEAE